MERTGEWQAARMAGRSGARAGAGQAEPPRAPLPASRRPWRRRWLLLGAVMLFYLVRDLLLYVALPAYALLKAISP
ncbi:MAG: hypothetical protein ABI742_07465 [Gemmatimonadota bacterium]